MLHQPVKPTALLLLLFTMAFFAVVWLVPLSQAQEINPPDSPLPTPTMPSEEGFPFDPSIPPPTATPTPPPSQEAEQALKYVAEQEGVPTDDLLLVNEQKLSYSLTSRTVWAFVIAHQQGIGTPIYELVLDPTTGQITKDGLNAIEAAEEVAYQAKYDKFEPALYDRLQIISDEETLPVAIWVASKPETRTEPELYAELAVQFPAAAEALAKGSTPMDVEDPALADQIQEAYIKLLTEDTIVRIQPVWDWLQGQNLTVESFEALPSLTATLPKSTILELAKREDVATIYLIEAQEVEEMRTAAATDHAPAVWRSGVDGSGERIAILEGSNINPSISCLNIVATRTSPQGIENHKTRTASVATCDGDPDRGIAYGADLVDAGYDRATNGQSNAVAALQWAFASPQNARVVNMSVGWEVDNNLNWTDRAFDYWVRTRNVTVVKSAGNSGGSISSPGKAWNVITVGAADDLENAAWVDDDMRSLSAYINPTGGASGSDREKPEVVAPGGNISTPAGTESGTSLAAPQVAGLAALLMDRHTSLRTWPEAVKAIIMASAVHNIRDSRGIPTGQDLRDGAGSIDAAVADEIAQFRQTSSAPCDRPCWWGFSTSSTNPSVNGSIYRSFYASRGERIRVALSWFARADGPNNYNNHRLDTNYNLYVTSPSGQLVGYVASVKNNYELSDFYALETGQYNIGVFRSPTSDNNEASNSIGLAWTKQATYLPDVRSGDNSTSWDSVIFTRNDGAEPKDVTITLFNQNGSYNSNVTFFNLQPNQRWYYNPTINGPWQGTAVINAGEDVSAVVLQHPTNTTQPVETYANVRQPTAEVHIPLLQKNNSNWFSDLFIQNTRSTATTLTVQYKAWSGSSCTQTYSLAANGRATINLNGVSCVGSTFVGSARITNSAGHPLAVAASQYRSGTTILMEESNVTGSAATVYTPLIQNYNSNWYSGQVIQNASGSVATLNGVFRNQAGTCFTPTYPNIAAYSPQVNPGPPGNPPCSSTVLSAAFGGGSAVAASINQTISGTSNWSDYRAVSAPSQVVSVPLWMKNSSGWSSGLVAQNVNNQATTVTIRYYNSSGSSTQSQSVPAYGSLVITNQPGGSSFFGSVMVTADRPVAVSVNHVRSTSEDGIMSHTGLHY